MSYPLLAMPQGAEWLVILAIVVLVFGASKLPDLARSSGQALRIFKAETKTLREKDEEPSALPPATTDAAVDPTIDPAVNTAVNPTADPAVDPARDQHRP